MKSPPTAVEKTERGYLYLRHRWPIRVMHWVNVLALTVLLMSGLNIFNAHPALNWGKSSYNGRPAVLQMYSVTAADGKSAGVTEVFGHRFDTARRTERFDPRDGHFSELMRIRHLQPGQEPPDSLDDLL